MISSFAGFCPALCFVYIYVCCCRLSMLRGGPHGGWVMDSIRVNGLASVNKDIIIIYIIIIIYLTK